MAAGMVSVRLGCLLVAVASTGCAGDERRPPRRDPPVAPVIEDTGPVVVEPVPQITAECVADPANALRTTCTVTVDPPMPIELSFARADSDDVPRVLRSEAVQAVHELVLYRMTAETVYGWSVSAPEHPEIAQQVGSFATEPLPEDVRFDLVTFGTSTATEDLLFSFGCSGEPYAVVTGDDGEVVWYQALAEGLPGTGHEAQGLTLTEDGTLLAIVDRRVVREFDFAGRRLLDLQDAAGDFERPVHHDAFRRDGFTWVLNAHDAVYPSGGGLYVSDGVYVFDEAGVLAASWDLDSFVTPSGFGPPAVYWYGTFPLSAVDWSHGNGLYVSPGGQTMISFYELDTVLTVDLLPGSPTFGTVESALVGSPYSELVAVRDYSFSSTVTTDLSFERPHHPQLLPDGRLLLYDNGFWGESRAIVLTLDHAAGTAVIDEEYLLGTYCAYQGGVFPLANGNLLASCAPYATFLELEAGAPEPVRQLSPTCPNGPTPAIARVIPLEL
jgi:hypothetical protein